MKVAVFSTKYYEKAYLNKFNADGKHQLTFFDASLNVNTKSLALGFETVCVLLNDIIDKETAVKLARIGTQFIDLRSVGYDNVDIKAATSNHITVMRVSAYSPQAIAEHAVAIILTLNRKTHKAYNRVRENNFSLENLMGFNLYGKTVGVVGTGKIGATFVELCKVLGAKLLLMILKIPTI